MEIKNLTRRVLPHVIAVALFIVLSFAYFYPALEGKVLKANDSTVSTINSKEIRDFRARFHKEPLWTNSIFSGMPAYLISTRYPGNLFKYVDTCLRVFQTPVSVLLLSMAGFYFLLLLFGLSPWLSFAGAIAYGFSSFLFQILAAGHNTQAIALAYMAPMIGGFYYAYRHNAVKGALLAGFMLTLELIANHPQITYYSFLCLLVYLMAELVYAIKQKSLPKFIRTSAILIIPVVLAVGINFGNLYTVYEYGKYSIRGKSDLTQPGQKAARGLDKDYITYWSYGVGETMNLLIPNFKGGSSQPFNPDSRTVRALRANNAGNYVNSVLKYWGSQPGTDGPHYVGAIVIFLFILGLVIVKGPVKWWLLVATVLSIMLAWGKNFMPLTSLFIDYFPGYNKFRAVTMILVISQFCIPLLGFLALKDIYEGRLNRKEIMKGFKIALGVSGGITLLVLLIPGIAGSFLSPYEGQFPDWLKTAVVADRKDLLRSDSFRSLIFILAGAGAILGFIYGKLRKEYSIALLAFLILVDLWTVDKRYLNATKFESQTVFRKAFAPTVADEAIMKDTTDFRVLNLSVSTFNDNSPTSYFFKSIGGYHGAKLERYQELIDSAIVPELYRFAAAEKGAKSIEDFIPVFRNTPALNMLDAKYVIYNPDAPPLVNNHALGNVWFVEKPVFADNANAELAGLNKIDPSKVAIIDKKFSGQVTAPAYPLAQGDTIYLVKYEPNELVYRYTAGGERLAIFSEIYYPAGWRCYIDGKESNYFRADYVLRAMIVPGGSHEIRFVFEPRSYIIGNKVSLASSVLFIILIAGYIAAQFRRKPKAENGTS